MHMLGYTKILVFDNHQNYRPYPTLSLNIFTVVFFSSSFTQTTFWGAGCPILQVKEFCDISVCSAKGVQLYR